MYGEGQFKSKIGPNEYMMKDGYIVVYQDVRGRWMSEGDYDNMRAYIPNKKKGQVDEASDTYDTIDWLVKNVDNNILEEFIIFKDVISGIRNVRKHNNIASKVLLDLKLKVNNEWKNQFNSLIIKLGNIAEIEEVDESIKGSNSFVVNNNEFFIPFNKGIDVEAEMVKVRTELEDKKGFLKSVMAKVNNEKFMSNAPEKVVQLELKKKNDAESQIKILEDRLTELSSL